MLGLELEGSGRRIPPRGRNRPGSVEAVAHYALYLHAMARWDGAAKWCQRLRELDPVSPRAGVSLLRFVVNTRHYELADDEFRKITDLDPENAGSYFQAGILFELQGRETDALAANFDRRGSVSAVPICRRFTMRRAKEECEATGESRSNSCGSRPSRGEFHRWTSQWHTCGWATRTERWKCWSRHAVSERRG